MDPLNSTKNLYRHGEPAYLAAPVEEARMSMLARPHRPVGTPGFVTADVDTCNGESPLAPGKSCFLRLNGLPADVTVECAATALTGSVNNLRGRRSSASPRQTGRP